MLHELSQDLTPVVSGHIVMKLFPQPLNLVDPRVVSAPQRAKQRGAYSLTTSLAGCTAAEKKELEASDAMEAKAKTYCSVTQGYELGSKAYMGCKEHYL